MSALLAERGAVIVDADAITRELQEPGQPVLAAIVEHFGDGVLTADGALDRQALARIVFNDPEELAVLNALVHPAVGAEIARRLGELAASDEVVILDVPLLVEGSRHEKVRYPVAGLLVVDVPEDVAVQRLFEQRGMDEADVRARMARQATREERRERADFVIDNSGSLEDLRRQVEEAWAWIESLRASTSERPRTET